MKSWCVAGRQFIETEKSSRHLKNNPKTGKIVISIELHCEICGRNKSQFLTLKRHVVLKIEVLQNINVGSMTKLIEHMVK